MSKHISNPATLAASDLTNKKNYLKDTSVQHRIGTGNFKS
jgi:hypothetical protein